MVLRRTIVVALALSFLLPQPAPASRGDAERYRPPIHDDPIPYGRSRKRQMGRYSKRHYGVWRWRLSSPDVIVLHFTGGSSYSGAWNTFAANQPNRGEMPGVCSHFVVDKDGSINKLVPTRIRCRHAVGVNYTSVGIEMVQETGRGSHWADRQILRRRRQMRASLKLVRYLKLTFDIRMRNVIGHSMADDSPYFKDLEGWRNDHTDWLARDVKVFRRRLRRMMP